MTKCVDLNDLSELKNVKAYIIRSELLKRTYTVFIDADENKFMYCLVESDPGKYSLINKESLDDVIYEIRLHATDIKDEFEKTITDVVDVLLKNS